MIRNEELNDVPAEAVEETVENFKFSGATSVEVKPQSDGKFTIIAIFGDTPVSSKTEK